MTIKDIWKTAQAGQRVTVRGWVRSRRVGKSCAFLHLQDGSDSKGCQIILDPPNHEQWASSLQHLTTGASCSITGVLQPSLGAGQDWEIKAEVVELYGTADPSLYPLQKKEHSLPFLREVLHLRPRTQTFGSIFRLRHHVARFIHEYFYNLDFFWVHTPIITSHDAEGAGELFRVTTKEKEHFFGRPSFLTVSGQLEAEEMALALGKVYTFGPTFRAESSNTTRHLSEFWMVEPEVAFADLTDIQNLAEGLLKYVLRKTVEECHEDLTRLHELHGNEGWADRCLAMATSPFQELTYDEGIDLLQKAPVHFQYPVSWGMDLQTEHERYLCENLFGCPVILKNYPKDIKAFYMRLQDNQRTVAAMDILMPGVGELVGGSQREERLDFLIKRMEELHLDQEDLSHYIDLRRFGSVPHGGFGLGFDRLLMYITGMGNIRDVTLAPRAPGVL